MFVRFISKQKAKEIFFGLIVVGKLAIVKALR